MGIQINGNTNNINAGIGSLSIEDINELDIVGVVTAANFKTGTTNVHSAGIEIAGINVLGANTPIGVGATIFNSGGAIFAGTSGVVTATAFHGSGANLTGIDTDLVSDTSPQLGGDLASNSHDILMAANDRIVFGSDALRVKHTGSHADIENTTGNITIKNDSSSSTEQILIQAKGGEDSIKAIANGAVELYHDNIKSLETIAEGIEIKKTASNANAFINLETSGGGQARINLITSSGNNRASRIDFYNQDVQQWTIINDYNQNGTNDFSIRHGAESAIRALPDGAVELYNDSNKMAETYSGGFKVSNGGELYIDGNAASGHCQLIMTRSDRSWAINNETNFRIYSVSGNNGNPTSGWTKFLEINHVGDLMPGSNASQDLGTSSTRWDNLYVNDLQLSNKGKSNDVDGTWGDWTLQEGESDVYMINNRSGKKFKMRLEEI